jgi:hypothetical protein
MKMIDFIIIRIVGQNKTERKNTFSSNLEIVKEKLSFHSVAFRSCFFSLQSVYRDSSRASREHRAIAYKSTKQSGEELLSRSDDGPAGELKE